MVHQGPVDDGLPIIATFESSIAAERFLTDFRSAGFAEDAVRIVTDAEKARLTKMGLSDSSGVGSTSIAPEAVPDIGFAHPFGVPAPAIEPSGKHEVTEQSSSPTEVDFRTGTTMLRIAAGPRKDEATGIVREAGGLIESPLITQLLVDAGGAPELG